MNKESYECPILEVLSFEGADIITESTCPPDRYEGVIVGEEAG